MLAVCMLLFAVLVGMAAVLTFRQKNAYENEMKNRWLNLARNAGISFTNAVNVRDYAFLEEFNKKLSEEEDVVYSAVLDDGMNYLVHTNSKLIGETAEDDLASRCAKERKTLIEMTSRPGGTGRMYETAVPIIIAGEVWGVARIGYSAARLDAIITGLYTEFGILAAIFLLAGIAGALFLARNIASPVVKLADLAEKVADGDFSVRSAVKRSDELGLLSDSFNTMVSRLDVSQKELKKHQQHLEDLVEERTAELKKANEQLKGEITERERAEEALQGAAREWQTTFDAISDAVFLLDGKQKILRCNKSMLSFLGKSADEVIGRQCWEIIHGESEPVEGCPIASMRKSHKTESLLLPIGDKVFNVTSDPVLTDDGKLVGAVHIVSDITERKQAEEQRKLVGRILEMINQSRDEIDVIRSILLLIKEFTGIEAAGIRLKEGIDYPYYEVNGFPKDFVEAENFLCARDRAGEPLLDSNGSPVLECMCGNIIRGRFDPSHPFFTEGGSFWSNCTTELLASTSEEDRQARTRNRCNGVGYESVALIPLRAEDEIIGLLQLNDKRENMFTPQLIAFFEEIGASIGISLARRWARDKLKERENYFRSLISTLHEEVIVLDRDYRISDVNDTFLSNHGFEREDVLGLNCYEVSHGYDKPCPEFGEECKLIEVFETGEPANCVHEHITGDGLKTWMDILLSPMKDNSGNVTHVIEASRNISDLIRTTEALRESEEKHRTLVENLPQKIFFKDRSLVYVACNENYARDLKITPEEIIGKDDFEFYPRELAEKYRADDKRIIESERTEDIEEEYMKDGQRFWVHTVKTPVKDKDGSTIGVLGIFWDITEHKHADEALRKSEGNLKEAQRVAHVGSWDLNVVTGDLYWSDEVYRIYGFEPQEFVPTYEKFLAILCPEDHERVQKQVDAALSGDADYNTDFRFVRPEGKIGWIHCEGVVTRDEKGSPLRFFGTQADITERKRAEEERDNLLFQATERTKEISCLYEVTKLLGEAERPLKEMYQSVVELIPLGWQYPDITCAKIVYEGVVFKTGNYKETPWNLTADIMISGKWAGAFEVTYLEKKPELDEGPFQKEERDLIDAVVREIEKMAERRQLEAQLQQSQKMEAIGRLAGGIAHDFNNLLTGILGYSQLTLDSLGKNDPMRLDIEEIKKAGESASKLTMQLLAFSRKQVLEPKIFNLNDTVADIEKMLQRVIGEDIEFLISLDSELGQVRADPAQVEQVIMNLAVNARDAMPNGGKLTIETANVELDEAYAANHVGAKPGFFVMLAVSDSGSGMDEDTRSHLFEPFFTTKEKGRGTGLGLSTVYGTVKQSGGYIWVYSEPGMGTTFKIYLPRVEETIDVIKPGGPKDAPVGGTETVLLVEDEEMVREFAKRVLTSSGYTVLEAGSGGEALIICEKHDGPIHLMLTDVVMPGMSGSELAERLAGIKSDMKVLYMSGYTENAIVHHGVLDSDKIFIQKPFTIESLTGKVREILSSPKK